MKLVAYADESGTDGMSSSLIVGGLVGLREEWVSFCNDWQHVLNKYDTKYFHFREWADASCVVRKRREPNSGFKNNPYKTWDQPTLDRFLFELAEIAVSGGKLVVGGYVPQYLLREEQQNGVATTKASPEELVVRNFFDSVVTTITRERCVLKRQGISFFFDHITDKYWRDIIESAYCESLKRHRQFTSYSIVSKGLRQRVEDNDTEFLPLQAADMIAYRARQKLEKLTNLDFSGPQWDELDNIIFKNRQFTEKERDETLRNVFVVPDDMTYEQAMDVIVANSKFKDKQNKK